MPNGTSILPIGMILDLERVVQGHMLTGFVVIMNLPHKNVYLILLGQSWLWMTQLKHDWLKNVLTFRQAGQKVHFHTTMGRAPDKALAPVHVENINMLGTSQKWRLKPIFKRI
jgi:hypothetical protein